MDGFSLFPYAEGKILAWDYTCRNTLADSYKEHTAVEVGYAAKQGEKDKYVNYEDLVNDNYYAKIFCEIFTLLLTVCTVFKSKVKISKNFVAFSEYMNFNRKPKGFLDDF